MYFWGLPTGRGAGRPHPLEFLAARPGLKGLACGHPRMARRPAAFGNHLEGVAAGGERVLRGAVFYFC
jgi:hypothetical protein